MGSPAVSLAVWPGDCNGEPLTLTNSRGLPVYALPCRSVISKC